MALFVKYRQGVMLYAGGVYDQPARYMDLMAVIESAVAEIEADKIREAERRASAKKPK